MDGREVLKQERKARGLSQDALANLIGKSTSAVAQFEAGRIRPLRHVAVAIDDALGTGTMIATAFGFSSSPVDVVALQAQVDALTLVVERNSAQIAGLVADMKRLQPQPRRKVVGTR